MDRITRSLEDQFFFKEDLKLIEKQRVLKQMRETKEALREASGIMDNSVLEKLIKLNIQPETMASLAIVPLIEVAWASGKIGQQEKETVLAAVNKFGWSNSSIDYALLERWLEHKPEPALFKAWIHYTEYICARMRPIEVQRLKTEIMSHAKAVAEASGGLLGIGKTSQQEKAVLEIIENTFVINREKNND